MGTKSHISKALPASIMSKRMGLIVLQQAMFRTECVYLNFPGHFLYAFQRYKTADGKSVERHWRDLEVLCYRILFYSLLFYKETLGCESSFHVCVKKKCSSFVHSTLNAWISLCLGTFVIENARVWLQACGLSPSYFICIMRHCWLKCTPWLVPLQYVINVCFFPLVSSYSVFSGGSRLDESDFMPVSKPKVFYL